MAGFGVSPPVLRLPVNPLRVTVDPGNTLAASLAFLFLPYRNIFIDIVRRDTAASSGTITPISSPLGSTWVLGSSPSTVGGFKTAGSDTYYNGSPTALSIACGVYNQAVITNPASRNVFAYWVDSSAEANGIEIGLQLNGGLMKPYCQITGGSSSNSAIGTAPASPPLPPSGGLNATTPLSFSVAGSYVGNAIRVAAGVPGSATLTGLTADTKSVVNLAQVFIGDAFANAATGRAEMWVAGWFRTLSAADLATVVSGNGSLPPGLLRRRRRL